MKFECSRCGSNASRLFNGTDGKAYTECLRCGEKTAVDHTPPRGAPERKATHVEEEPSAW